MKTILPFFYSLSLISLASVVTLPGCSADAVETSDNGSNTSWLKHCDEDEACGEGLCANGVCTEECTSDSACSELSETARCATAAELVAVPEDGCGKATSLRVCVPSCKEDCDELGDGFACVDGECAPVACGEQAKEYEPCQDKECGDSCTRCAPDDADCNEPEEPKRCSADGVCSGGPVECENASQICRNRDESACELNESCLAIYGTGVDANASEYLGCRARTDAACQPPSGPGAAPALLCGVDAGGSCAKTEALCLPDSYDVVDCTECELVEPYEPCGGKACGESCSVCPPGANDCIETAVEKSCDAAGQCVATGSEPGQCETAQCAGLDEQSCAAAGCMELSAVPLGSQAEPQAPAEFQGCQDGSLSCTEAEACGVRDGQCYRFPTGCMPEAFTQTSCEDALCCEGESCEAEYQPCASKSCGDSCQLCAPDDAACAETAVEKACDAAGQCVAGVAECGTAYEPCASKSCGDSCQLCAPDDAACVETAVVKACDAAGQCAAGVAECGTAYDPCAGKSCGERCQQCPPGAADCIEASVENSCDAAGQCRAGVAECAPVSECSGLGEQACVNAECTTVGATLLGPDAMGTEFSYAGCIAKDLGCGAALTCGKQGGECFQFRDTCLPAGFEMVSCEQPECCQGAACAESYVPCAGKICGDSCSACAPDDLNCVEDAVVKACTVDGQCLAAPSDCSQAAACAAQDELACASSAACAPVQARPVGPNAGENPQPAYAGCVEADIACAEVETCAIDAEEGCQLFNNSCVPAGYTTVGCDSPECL